MSRIPSPARSQGAPVTSRRSKPRRTLSMTSAKSDASARLTSIVDQYLNDDKFKMSPLRRKSVLPDDTDIDAPRRASWWKRLDSSSRDVLEALDTNRMPDELLLEDYEFEVQKDKQNQSVPESSDNESVASIIVPQRRLFNQKKQTQCKFGDIAVSRKSLGKTNLEDQDKTIHSVPKNLFKQGQPKNRPVFPAALLNSTNETINKTVEPEPEPNKKGRNLFGQAGTKRKKNMFTDFVLSESEDDSEVQHKVFGFKKNDNKRMSLATRNRRMPSLTPSVTTDIDIDDWNLLPSSTMIVNGSVAMEVSRVITDNDLELAHGENQDVTLTEPNESLELESNKQNTSKNKQSLRRSTLSTSKKQPDVCDKTNGKVSETKTVEHAPDDDQDATLTEANESLKLETTSENPKRQTLNRTRLSKSRKLSDEYNKTLIEEKTLESKTPGEHHDENQDVNEQTTVCKSSVEDQMVELHGESGKSNKSEQEIEQSIDQRSEISAKEISKEDPNEDIEEMVWNDNDDDGNENETAQEENDRENDEDVENYQDDDEDVENEQNDNEDVGNDQDDEEDDDQEVSDQVTPTKDVPNKSQKIVESSVKEQQTDREAEVVDVTPNATYDTTGRNRTKDATLMKSPELVLNNMSRDNMTFKPIGRSTSFRKTRSPTENIISRPTLIPIQESFNGSDGSRKSGTGGSGWDSHRTTRKTLRQTFGKDFSPRKSLRALVMEKSAKRQTDVSKNASKIYKTRNNTILDEAGKDATRVNETTNKTVLEEIRDGLASNRNLFSDRLPSPKSPAPGVSAHHVSDPNISKPQISHYKSIHGINELGTSPQLSDRPEPDQAINDSGPELSIHASYGHGMSVDASDQQDNRSLVKNRQTTTEQRKSVKKSMPLETDHDMQEELDYDPSLQEEATHEESSKEITERENSDQQASALKASENEAQEVSDHEEYKKEGSETEESAQDVEAEKSNQEEDAQETEPEVEVEESEHDESEIVSEPDSEHEESEESESDQEEQEQSQQEIEPESEQEDHEHSQQEIEPESEDEEHDDSQQAIEEVSEQEQCQEQSQQELEPESEQEDREDSHQEIEPESEGEEHDDSQQAIEEVSVQEQSQQEIEPESEQEDREDSHQEIETESEDEEHDDSQQKIEVSEQEQCQESVNDISQQCSDQESDREMDSDNEHVNDGISDDDHVDAHEVERQQNSKRYTERVVFDNILSDQEIDYDLSERVSRQITDNEISEQVSDVEMEDQSLSRVSTHDNHDVSVGTKKSSLLMQMQKIAQENMELRQKIREKVANSFKQKREKDRNLNPLMSPTQPKIFSSMRRINKPEPKKPKIQPRKTTTIAIGTLPKEFLDDLKYKPPKRFQPANAAWITKRLYKYLETKLEPKYDYRARVRAEELVQSIYGFAKLTRRRDLAPQNAVDELKREMARLNIVTTHFEFYEFFHEFMPREIRIKVNPDIVNKIPMPANGIFGDILQSRPALDG